MGQKEIQRFCKLKEPEKRFARRVYEARGISARGYHRVLKTARTIADLAGEEWIQKEHLSEAFGYRALEERIWGQKQMQLYACADTKLFKPAFKTYFGTF